MPIYLAQLKCPNNHCVLGAAGSYPDQASADDLARKLREQFDLAVKHQLLNPWCGLCNSRMLNVELRGTGFETMDEAMPVLRELERRQQETVQHLKQTRN